jgi:hypothetical protein
MPGGRRGATALFLAAIGLAVVVALLYPVLNPSPVHEPVVEIDPAEGKVWLDTSVVLELRGSYSAEEVAEGLRIEPPLQLRPGDIAVEQEARLPLHDRMPWATTRITLNASGSALFQPHTRYKVELFGKSVDFETITVPEVVASSIEGDEDGDRLDVPTHGGVVFTFNKAIDWRDEYLEVDPPAGIDVTASNDISGRTVVTVRPAPRFENASRYSIKVLPGVRDVHDHTGAAGYDLTFTTWPTPQILSTTPAGITQPVTSPLRVEYQRPVEPASAEAQFSVQPAIPGSFVWESDRAMLWQPAAPLPYSTEYTVVAGGTAKGGDSYAPRQWTFRTQDPPVFAEVTGELTAPTILEARASGGLGSFAYQWSSGGSGAKTLVNVPYGETRTIELRVTSGDQAAVQTVQVTGPPAPRADAVECPPGWDMPAVSLCYLHTKTPSGSYAWIARTDLRDPNLEVTAALAGDHLGAVQTVGKASASRGALLTVNGDFFHNAPPGVVPVGPLVVDGSVGRLAGRFESAFAVSRDGRPYAMSGGDPSLQLHGAAGTVVVSDVNSSPDADLAVFNAFWGPVLNLSREGCVAIFAPSGPAELSATGYQCGPVTGLPLRSNELVVVARGSAVPWLEGSLQAPIAIGDPAGIGTLDLLVGGGPVLIAGGAPLPLAEQNPPRAPRTAIGADAAGFLYVVVIDGRRADSPGMTLAELRDYLAALGLVEAVNLDGGGSTEFVMFDQVRNVPSDGKERPVAGVVELTRPRGDCMSWLVRC